MSLAHAQQFDAIALHMVKAEIDASLLQVQNALSAYIDDNSNTFGLVEATESMSQVYGVLRLLEITGGIELADATNQLLQRIVDTLGHTTDAQLKAISEGLMLLSRYLEFVVLRENLLPQFLLSSINRIRSVLDLPLLREGYFLEPYLSIIQMPRLDLNLQKPDISTAQAEQLTVLYKASLNHILQKKNNPLDFQAVKLVSHFASMLASDSPSELYWHAVNIAFTELEYCKLSEARLRAMIQVERNLNRFVADTATFNPLAEDIADILTLSACRDHQAADELRQQLGLDYYVMTDTQASLLARYLFGPDSNTIHTTTTLMQQEITSIKNKIDSMQHGDELVDEGFDTISEQLHQVANALTLLNLEEASTLISYQGHQAATWHDLSNVEDVNNLMDALLYAGNALTVLDRSYVAGSNQLPFNNLHISLHQLEDAREILVKQARESLNLSMHSLSSYLETKDLLHMSNIPAMFEGIGGALLFLDAPIGHDILKTAAEYVTRAFVADKPQPSMHAINLLANVMVSIDHHLEGLEQVKPISVHPFAVGVSSANQLKAA